MRLYLPLHKVCLAFIITIKGAVTSTRHSLPCLQSHTIYITDDSHLVKEMKQCHSVLLFIVWHNHSILSVDFLYVVRIFFN